MTDDPYGRKVFTNPERYNGSHGQLERRCFIFSSSLLEQVHWERGEDQWTGHSVIFGSLPSPIPFLLLTLTHIHEIRMDGQFNFFHQVVYSFLIAITSPWSVCFTYMEIA